MIWILTIIIAILIVWTIISADICMDIGDCDLTDCDGILEFLSKLYWWLILGTILLVILIGISYAISSGIICASKNGDDKSCNMWNVEKVEE